MTGRHTRPDENSCDCLSSQYIHTCVKLAGKENHLYDENAAQAQTAPLPMNSVDWPPPSVAD